MQFHRDFTSRSCYHMLESWLASYLPPTRETVPGCDLDHIVCLGQKGKWTAYFSQESVRQAGELGLAFLSNPAAVQRHITVSGQVGEACLLTCPDVNTHQVEHLTDEELARSLETFFAAYRLLQAYYQISGTYFMAPASARVMEELDAPPAQQGHLFSLVTIGDQRGLKIFQEKHAWLTLLLEASVPDLTDDHLNDLLQHHNRLYAYVGDHSDNLGSDTLEQFYARFKRDAHLSQEEIRQKLKELKSHQDLLQKRREQALATCKFSQATRLLVDSLATIGVHRLQLREIFTIATHQSYSLVQRVFRKYQEHIGPLDQDLLRQLSVDEVLAIARGEKLDQSCVAKRFSHGFCSVYKGSKQEASDEEAIQRVEALLGSARKEKFQEDEVKGVVGNAGPIVRGKAFVLHPGLSREEQVRLCRSEMQQGDILVAGMTYPSLVPACEMAGALVTDFGGVTCHAVIIAREFDIPCIVGTDHATQAVQTGDMVEVDTSTQCVRILHRKMSID